MYLTGQASQPFPIACTAYVVCAFAMLISQFPVLHHILGSSSFNFNTSRFSGHSLIQVETTTYLSMRISWENHAYFYVHIGVKCSTAYSTAAGGLFFCLYYWVCICIVLYYLGKKDGQNVGERVRVRVVTRDDGNKW
jgi:hypothetical protein